MIKPAMQKTITKIGMWFAISLFSTASFAECTFNSAQNRSLALQKWTTDYQTQMSITLQKSPDDYNKLFAFFSRLTDIQILIGPLMAAGKYAKACDKYDEIERLIGVELTPNAAGTMTMEQIQQGINRADKTQGCDMVQAVEKMMENVNSFEQKFAAGKISDAQKESISIELGPIQSMITEDPTKACQQLDAFNQKWGF